MAATVSRTSVPACNACDICRKRERWIESRCLCFECKLNLCKDCTFSHSWIPACETHQTIPAGTGGYESVDLKRKNKESTAVKMIREGLDSADICLKRDYRENVDEYRNTKVLEVLDSCGNTKVLDSMAVCLNIKGSGSADKMDECIKTQCMENVDVCGNTMSSDSVDECLNTDSGTAEAREGIPQFVLQCEFNSKREKEQTTKIRAVLLLECGVILATDWANCNLKCFDMGGRFLGDYYFHKSGVDAGRVHGLALKDASTVYVTLPSLKKIDLISIERNRDKVRFIRICSFKTIRRYFGIAHMASRKHLIVGTKNSVDIMSDKCQLIYHVGVGRFTRPYNIEVDSSGSVLVSDTTENCLYRISAGDKVERIDVGEEKRSLREVTVDMRGNIFFGTELTSGVGWARDRELLGWLLTDQVQKAVGVHYQQTNTGHWLVVSEKDGTIKVFKLKN